MHSPDHIGLTYEVATEELAEAARAVEAVTDVARTGLVEAFPSSAELGHAALSGAVMEFSARWDTGLSHLIGDSDEVAVRLRRCAEGYRIDDEGARELYERLAAGWRPEPVQAPWWVAANAGPSLVRER